MTLAPQALKVSPPPRIFVLTLFFLLSDPVNFRSAPVSAEIITVNPCTCSLADAIHIGQRATSNTHNTNCATAGSGDDTINAHRQHVTLSADADALAIASTHHHRGRRTSTISGNNSRFARKLARHQHTAP